MTMSSTIQEVVLEFLSDKQEHSVQDIKHYLREQDVRDYTEGQFAGSLNTLMRNGSIKKVDRDYPLAHTQKPNKKENVLTLLTFCRKVRSGCSTLLPEIVYQNKCRKSIIIFRFCIFFLTFSYFF